MELKNKGALIVFQRVTIHCRPFGNEEADRLAKKGPDIPLHYESAKRKDKRKY